MLALPPAAWAADAAAPPADAQNAAPPLVIVADVSDNATQNSQIRATLYEVARDHGYDAAGKLDVEGTAAQQSLMKAGTITTDPAELEQLRTALKVAVVVRISKDADQGSEITAHITIVSKEGVRQKVVSAARGAPGEALRSALDTLLPHVYNPEKKTAESDVKVLPPTAAGALLLEKPPPDKPFDAQQTWQDRGGFRPTYGALAFVTGTYIKNDPFDSGLGRAGATGVGGGLGVHVGFMYMPIPDPTVATGTFVAFRGGVGLDTNFFWVRKPEAPEAPSGYRYRNQALWVTSVPFELGLGIAGGHFIEKTAWQGVVVGVAYAPALQFTMDLKDTVGDGKFAFNPAGGEVWVDITKFDVRETTENSMQIRLLAWGLVPIAPPDKPGFLSLGVGAIWY